MKNRKWKGKQYRKQLHKEEESEITILKQWIECSSPEPGSNPLSLAPLPEKSPVGILEDGTFSKYAGATKFMELPISKKTMDGLKNGGYVTMTDIQRASLPHALYGRDILGAAKTGSGKTLAFVVPVLEKLYKERWGPEDGVGSVIISPTRELAGQLFDVLRTVGAYHNFSAGLLIGGRKDVKTEKERANELNILVCTPGRLLQHMNETPNFDCSQLQVLVLDEADRILDIGFKRELNAIISQLPKYRQTLLFSATQTKSVQDLARLSLKDPEYLSVHKESRTSTPSLLQQTAIVVPIDQKLDMLWSFIKTHLNSKILVFLSTCKQVRFVFEAFKRLRPGIPLKYLIGKMQLGKRMRTYSEFCERRSVLFCTDLGARGLDYNKAIDWVVQVDCPENVQTYIHRVGRTARYLSGGKALLFLMPSEMKMLEKLEEAKVPIHFTKANKRTVQPVSGSISSLMVKDEALQHLAQRAFITYMRSVYLQKDKEVFDVTKLSLDDFSASLGLPLTPNVRFLHRNKSRTLVPSNAGTAMGGKEREPCEGLRKMAREQSGDEAEDDFLHPKPVEEKEKDTVPVPIRTSTQFRKKKKLKININKPAPTRVIFDDNGNPISPGIGHASLDANSLIDQDKRVAFYKRMREEMKLVDKEDKVAYHKRQREKQKKEKMKRKRRNTEEEEEDFESEPENKNGGKSKKTYFHSDDEGKEKEGNNMNIDSISLKEQEALALKLLNSMHS